VRQTKQTVRQRRDDLEDTLRAVRDDVTAAWEALVTATSRIESIAAQVRANEIAVEGSRQEALVGQRTTLDVLDQESDLFQSQVDLVAARRDQIVASYRLKAAVGQLTAAGIELPVQPYDSEVYYDGARNRWIGLGESPDDDR
jgi:outer membrane protein TolC